MRPLQSLPCRAVRMKLSSPILETYPTKRCHQTSNPPPRRMRLAFRCQGTRKCAARSPVDITASVRFGQKREHENLLPIYLLLQRPCHSNLVYDPKAGLRVYAQVSVVS